MWQDLGKPQHVPSVQPPRRGGAVELLFGFHFPGELPGDQRGAGFLVETGGDVVYVSPVRPPSGGGSDSQFCLTAVRGGHRDKLQEKLLLLLRRRHGPGASLLAPRVGDFEVHRQGGVVG